MLLLALVQPAGDATLNFTGTANQTYTQSGDVINGLITINKASGTVTLASAATWNAAGQNLTVTSGTLDLAGFALSTGTLTVSGGAFTGSLRHGGYQWRFQSIERYVYRDFRQHDCLRRLHSLRRDFHA